MNHSWMGRLAIVFIPTQTLCLRQQEEMLWGLTKMKYRDLILYAVSFLALTLFLLTPLAAEPNSLANFLGASLCQEPLDTAEHLVTSLYWLGSLVLSSSRAAPAQYCCAYPVTIHSLSWVLGERITTALVLHAGPILRCLKLIKTNREPLEAQK